MRAQLEMFSAKRRREDRLERMRRQLELIIERQRKANAMFNPSDPEVTKERPIAPSVYRPRIK